MKPGIMNRESMPGPVLVLAGGVGGAKLALGLTHVLNSDQLIIVVNTADDEEFHGLHVSPDIDTMMYTLSGLSNKKLGWGVTGDSQKGLSMLSRYGNPTWFTLGDKDLATHIKRTQLLRFGWNLSEVTRKLSHSLGISHLIAPMTDDKVRTLLHTDQGILKFQEYFVQHHHKPKIYKIDYVGASNAMPSTNFSTALEAAQSIIICPSNPFLSIAPILAVNGVRELIRKFQGPRIAVSPLASGQAFLGPTAKIMEELSIAPTSLAVAELYKDICDIFIIDKSDAEYVDSLRSIGLTPYIRKIAMNSKRDKIELARSIYNIINNHR